MTFLRGSIQGVRTPLLSIADQGFVACAGLLVSAFVGRSVGSEGLGLYSVTVVVVLIIHALQNSMVLQAMSVIEPRVSSDQRAAYRTLSYLVSLVGIGVLTGLGAMATVGARQAGLLSTSTATGLLACLLYSNPFCLQNLFRRQLYVDQAPGQALGLSAAYLALSTLGLCTLWVMKSPSVASVYIALAAASLLICVQQWLWRRAHLQWLGASRFIRYGAEHWEIGKWTLLSLPFVIGTYHAYYVLTSWLLSVPEAGALKAADTLVVPFEQLGVALSLLFVPLLAGQIDDMPVRQQWAWLARLLIAFVAAAVVYALLVLWFGKGLLGFLFGEKMNHAAMLLPVLSAVPIVKALSYPPAIVLHALKRQDLIFANYGFATVTTLAIGVPLLKKHGILGAAAGLVASGAAFALFSWVSLLWAWRGRGMARLQGLSGAHSREER